MAGRATGTIIVVGLGLLFVAIGAGVGFYIGKPILDNARASESWPTAPGRITESELERYRDDGKTMYTALVVYEYSVGNQQWEGDSVWFGQYSSSSRSEINRTVTQYPVGRTVDVYYQPDDPANSVLQPGATTSSYIVFSIGMVFLAIGSLLVLATVLKGFFVVTVMATSPEDSFAGGATWTNDRQHPHFGDDQKFDTNMREDASPPPPIRFEENDDDAFPGIPG